MLWVSHVNPDILVPVKPGLDWRWPGWMWVYSPPLDWLRVVLTAGWHTTQQKCERGQTPLSRSLALRHRHPHQNESEAGPSECSTLKGKEKRIILINFNNSKMFQFNQAIIYQNNLEKNSFTIIRTINDDCCRGQSPYLGIEWGIWEPQLKLLWTLEKAVIYHLTKIPHFTRIFKVTVIMLKYLMKPRMTKSYRIWHEKMKI